MVTKSMRRRLWIGAIAAASLAWAGCDRVPLLAPSGSTVALSAAATSLPTSGRTEVTAFVVESGGTPVHNGTRVRFSATLGRMDPAEVETRGGVATTTFVAGTASGTAEVRATSGGATATGEGETPSNVVTIRIGAAAAESIAISASPVNLSAAGGVVTVTAAAFDGSGNGLSGVPIAFSTTAGTLSAFSATTDENGDARVFLTTTRTADVTARVGSGEDARTVEVTVTVGTASTIGLSVSPADPDAGETVTLTVTPTIPAGGDPPRVVVAWGDGSQSNLGVVSTARIATHTYSAAGTYAINATSTSDGVTSVASTSVTVKALGPVGVNISASSSTPKRCTPVTLTAEPTPAGAVISRYEWEIVSNVEAENAEATTTGTKFTAVFKETGTKTILVSAFTADGRRGDGQTTIVVQDLAIGETCQA
jgi:adhesin/invasin